MSVFNDIMYGINEAIEYEKGKLKAKTRKFSITLIKKSTENEIENIQKLTLT